MLDYLRNLPRSIYFCWEEDEIRCCINENEGRRYLAELILLNEASKADLDIISDCGSFEESQLMKSLNHQEECEAQSSLLSS